MTTDIVGYGGGKGGSHTARVAKEAPDSLRSKAYARVLDLVCEGPIQGLVNGYQSIFLDGTPLMNADLSLNFQGVGVDYRLGTQAQTHIAGFSSVESEVAVGVEIKALVPVVRTITASSQINAIRLRISVPSLRKQNTTNGDLGGSSVSIAIDLDSGGGYVEKITDTITGKTSSKYERNYTLELSGPGPWTFRVRRLTPDSITDAIQDKTIVDSYTAIEDGKLRYPNSALMAVMVDASQFDQIPTRAYDLYLRQIQVPVNYDPALRTYTGIWDGTFKVAWTDNPAWCLYDMMTAPRFGLGNYLGTGNVDKWALYQIAQYCDQLVPDGKGGTEPRFTCNLYLQTREDAFKVVTAMASIFRGMMYWGSSLLSPVQDAPSDPVALYNASNVIDGAFEYTGSDLMARHTVAVVAWNDPGDAYKIKYEYVEDVDGIARYGITKTDVVAIGCTSRGQANRVGRWLLYTEKTETELVGFRVGLDGNLARPGQIIQVQDPHRAAIRFGGRVLSATTTSVTLDAPVVIQTGKTYYITCVMPNAPAQPAAAPLISGFGAVEKKLVTNVPGTYTTLTVSTAFSAVPAVFSVWAVSVNDLALQTFRVISVAETAKMEFSVTAVAHNPGKFDLIDFGIALQPLPISLLQNVVPPPTGVLITQHEYTSSLGVKLVLSVGWIAPAAGLTYRVEWRKDQGNWVPLAEVSETTVDLPGSSTPGDYTARVTSVNAAGKTSIAAVSPIYTLVGKLTPPVGISALRANTGLWEIDLSWDFYPNQPDLLATEIWVSPTNDRTTAVLLSPVPYPRITAIETDLENGVTHYYWARSQNTSLVYSPWFPLSPLAGVKGTTLNDATKILTLLSGAIAGSAAGLTIGQRLDKIDFPGTGISSDIIKLQTDNVSLHSQIDGIGARLNPPDGDIANAITRIQTLAAVSHPTPVQLTAPVSPYMGDAWYDSSSGGALRFWNGTAWVLASSAIVSPTAPASRVTGTLWKDTSTSKNFYRVWNGSAWMFAARPTLYQATAPATTGVAIGDTWKDTSTGKLYVFDGVIWVDAQSSDVAAIASSVTALQTTVGEHTSQIRETMTSVGGIAGLYSVKVDIDGHLAGFALSSTLLPGGTGTISDFVVNVNRFAVGDSTISKDYPFIITKGQVYIKDAYIGDASVNTLRIKGNSVIVPVSAFSPGAVVLSTTDTTVQTATIDFGAFAPSAVQVFFSATTRNGGGGNGATNTSIYRDGILVFSNQCAIVNNIYSNTVVAAFSDTPGPGLHSYLVQSSYTSTITSADMVSRSLSLFGALR